MRGDLWQAAAADTTLVGWLEVSADSLAAAQTVTVAAGPPAPDVGWPLTIHIPADTARRSGGCGSPSCTRCPAPNCNSGFTGCPAPVLRQLDSALAATLDLAY